MTIRLRTDDQARDTIERIRNLEAANSVHSIDGTGGPLTGDVTLSEGDGIDLTQIGQNIEIAATATVEPWVFASATIDTSTDTPIASGVTGDGEMGYTTYSRWLPRSFTMQRGMGSVFSTPGATALDRNYVVAPPGSYEILATAELSLGNFVLAQQYAWVKLMAQVNAWAGSPGALLKFQRPGGTQPYRAGNWDGGGSASLEPLVLDNEFFFHLTGTSAFSFPVWLTDGMIYASGPGIDVYLLLKRLPDGTL